MGDKERRRIKLLNSRCEPIRDPDQAGGVGVIAEKFDGMGLVAIFVEAAGDPIPERGPEWRARDEEDVLWRWCTHSCKLSVGDTCARPEMSLAQSTCSSEAT